MITEIRLNIKSFVFTFVVLFTTSLTFCLGQYSNDADDDGYWVIQSPIPPTQRPTWISYGSQTEFQPNSFVGQIDGNDHGKNILLKPNLTSNDTFQDFTVALTVNSSITDFAGNHFDNDFPTKNSPRYVIDRISSDKELINETQSLTNFSVNTGNESINLNSSLTDFYPAEKGDAAKSSFQTSHYRTEKMLDQKKINFFKNVFGIKVVNSQKSTEDFSQINGGKRKQTTQAESGYAASTSLDLNKADFLSKVFGIRISKTLKPVESVEQSVDVVKTLSGFVTPIHSEKQGSELISENSKSDDEAKEHSAAYDESEDKSKQEQYNKEESSQGILKAEYPQSQSDDGKLDHNHKGNFNKEPEDNCSGFLRFHRDSKCKKNFNLIGLGFVGVLAISFAFVFILFFCVCKSCRCIQIYLRRRQCSYVPLSTKN